MTQFTIASKATHKTRLLTSSEGDAHAYLFSSKSEADDFASHLDDYDDLEVIPVENDQLRDWALVLKDRSGATAIVKHHPAHSTTIPIGMFLIRPN